MRPRHACRQARSPNLVSPSRRGSAPSSCARGGPRARVAEATLRHGRCLVAPLCRIWARRGLSGRRALPSAGSARAVRSVSRSSARPASSIDESVMTAARTTRTLVMLLLGVSGCVQPAGAQASDSVGILVKIWSIPRWGVPQSEPHREPSTARPLLLKKPRGPTRTLKARRSSKREWDSAPARSRRSSGLFSYGRVGAAADAIGEVGGVPLRASFDDYEFWGPEGGVRLRPGSGVGPYATNHRRISPRQRDPGAAANRFNDSAVTGHEASTVPSVAVGGGMLSGSAGFAMGVEVALRYAGAPTAPAGRALEPDSDAGARWSLPIGLVVRF